MAVSLQVLRRSYSRFSHSSSLFMRVASAKRTTVRLSDAVNSGLLPCVQTLSPRFVSVSASLGASEEELERAKARVTQLKEDPGNEVKLKLYGLFKQSLKAKPILQKKGSGDTSLNVWATIGACNTKKPSAFDLVARAKWNAWNSLGDLSQSDARQQYCKLVDELVVQQGLQGGSKEQQAEKTASEYSTIVVTDDGGARTIMLNRPAKLNALSYKMYQEVQHALQTAGKEDSVVVTVITGAGDYYCSGNDLSNFAQIPPEGPQKLAAEAKKILQEFVSTFIQFPKPLIAAVNGPAVGVSVTLLGLCDLVYAAENATFHTPFMQLGQSPEGCSSLLFPRIMGGARANEVLLVGHKLTAVEAYERGLVTRVFPAQEFQDRVKEIISQVAGLPPMSLQKSKQLLRQVNIDALEQANYQECELLEERWLSEECMRAIMDFMQRKSK